MNKDTEQLIKQSPYLEVVVDNAYELAQTSKDAFTMLRRMSFGASDSSILLGVNPFKKYDALIAEKLLTEVTPAERMIGELENVRRGVDLEPIILDKFEKWYGSEIEMGKPQAMFKIKDYPYLTVNFDGVIALDANNLIPVEAKYVSPYAIKYWQPQKAIDNPIQGSPMICGGAGIEEHIQEASALYGIPVYYYTQVQQQIMALNSDYGYMAALFDKGWELKVFKIYRDGAVINELKVRGKNAWNTVQERKTQG